MIDDGGVAASSTQTNRQITNQTNTQPMPFRSSCSDYRDDVFRRDSQCNIAGLEEDGIVDVGGPDRSMPDEQESYQRRRLKHRRYILRVMLAKLHYTC